MKIALSFKQIDTLSIEIDPDFPDAIYSLEQINDELRVQTNDAEDFGIISINKEGEVRRIKIQNGFEIKESEKRESISNENEQRDF